MEEMIRISVIIPTRNRSKLLDITLNGIASQTLPKEVYEVIICDNESTDDTKAVYERYRTSILNLSYIKTTKPGLHVGRHAGMKQAKSDLLVYIDDDIIPFPDWLETILNSFTANEDVVIIGGKNLPKYEDTPPFWILEKWNQLNRNGERILGDLSLIDLGDKEKEISPYYVFGCNFSVRREIIIKAGGFHPDGMPFELIQYRGDGESYISSYILKNNLKALYHPTASVYHWVTRDRMTEDYFLKRHYCQGISDAYTHLRNQTISKKSKSKKQQILEFLNGSFISEIKKSIQLTDFEKKTKKSYLNGFQFLCNYYKSNDSLKDWVHKENYYD